MKRKGEQQGVSPTLRSDFARGGRMVASWDRGCGRARREMRKSESGANDPIRTAPAQGAPWMDLCPILFLRVEMRIVCEEGPNDE